MIFVTVGTHEQNFDRLLRQVDVLIESGVFTEEVIVQSGYSNYKVKNCKEEKFFDFDVNKHYLENSSLVICHGGPSTFMVPLSLGIPTIVVPRREKFGEHVNDHQFDFAHKVKQEGYGIYIVDDISNLGDTYLLAKSNNEKNMNKSISTNRFINEFEEIVNGMFK